MKYQIKVNYDTGDSFHHEPNQEVTLDLVHENLDVAKDNIKRIKQHADMYRELNGYNRNPKKLEDFEDCDWFVKHRDKTTSEHCLKLKTDQGNELQLWCQWVGYFENFNFVEIIPMDNELKLY